MSEPIEAVLFDHDGTLVEYERPSNEVLDVAFDRAGVEPFCTVGEYYERYFEFLGKDVPDLREHCFAAIAANHGHDPDLGQTVAGAYAAERESGGVRLLEGARSVVKTFARELAVGLVTNGPPDHQ